VFANHAEAAPTPPEPSIWSRFQPSAGHGSPAGCCANTPYPARQEEQAVRSMDTINEALREAEERRARAEERAAELSRGHETLLGEIAACHETEAALRDSEGRLRRIIDDSPDGIAVVNEEGAIIAWSRGEEEIAVYDEVVRRFGDAGEAALRELVTKAIQSRTSQVKQR